MTFISSEDIFLKAAIKYYFRIYNNSPDLENYRDVEKIGELREELSDLCEKILALREVGALPK